MVIDYIDGDSPSQYELAGEEYLNTIGETNIMGHIDVI